MPCRRWVSFDTQRRLHWCILPRSDLLSIFHFLSQFFLLSLSIFLSLSFFSFPLPFSPFFFPLAFSPLSPEPSSNGDVVNCGKAITLGTRYMVLNISHKIPHCLLNWMKSTKSKRIKKRKNKYPDYTIIKIKNSRMPSSTYKCSYSYN